MVHCEKFLEKIFDYVDNLIPSDKKREVENHVKECLNCRGIFDDAKAIRQRLRGLRVLKTSPDFETVLRARIRMERSLSRRGIFDWPSRLPVYAVAGSLAVITAFFIFTNSQNSNSNRTPFISQTINENHAAGNSANLGPTVRERVRYPMDNVPLTIGRGTRLDSDELRRSATLRPDSARANQPLPVQAVEFEF
jgi:hypothetical protein